MTSFEEQARQFQSYYERLPLPSPAPKSRARRFGLWATRNTWNLLVALVLPAGVVLIKYADQVVWVAVGAAGLFAYTYLTFWEKP